MAFFMALTQVFSTAGNSVTAYAVDTNGIALAAEEQRKNNANLKDDFGPQGSNGWYYGTCDWDGTKFQELEYDSQEGRYFNNGKPELKSDFVEPGQGKCAAYKWIAAENGDIQITGEYVKFPNAEDEEANGVTARIFQNEGDVNVKKFMGEGDGIQAGNISSDVIVPIDETLTVAKGDEIIFAVNPEGNDAWDSGRWTIEIKSVGEPAETIDAKAPKIDIQPSDITCEVEGAATLSVKAVSEDEGTLSYQWYSSAAKEFDKAQEVEGATEESYMVPTDQEGTTYYYCKVTNTNAQATGTKTASLDSDWAAVIVTSVSETPAVRTNEANLEMDFSGEQGKNGWFYGYCAWNGENFTELTYDADKWTGENGLELKADFVHPGENDDYSAAYKWTTAETGKIYISGAYIKSPNSAGAEADGVCLRIFQNPGETNQKEFIGGDINKGGITAEVTADINMELDVKEGDAIIFAIHPGQNNAYDGGRLSIKIRPEEKSGDVEVNGLYKTNLMGLTSRGGEWKETEEGMYSNAIDRGDCFLFSESKGTDFVYSTDVTFKQKQGAASLIFRNASTGNNDTCYAVNVDAGTNTCKFWRWQNEQKYQKDAQLIDAVEIPASADNKYNLKVIAIDSWISFYVNDTLIASSGDYTLSQISYKGQYTSLKEGYFGLLNFNGEMVFQNTYYEEITNAETPLLGDIKVTAAKEDGVEANPQFVPTEPITIQYVKNDVESVNVEVTKQSDKAVVTVTDQNGKAYEDGKNIPVEVGINWIDITSSVEIGGQTAALTYRVDVHRRQADEIYYNEPYRGQFHYSIKDGWGNDPNGLVYYNGKYHLFHQFYDDIKWQWGLSWAHMVSEDLIHWTEEPVAIYPDANGSMYSGCAVVDENNTSGLFKDGEGGLVFLITANGNGERVKLAYSEDEGKTWTKKDDIVLDWNVNDDLNYQAFRDPKVFRWENKWFMVLAGGPLRIFSSDNLQEWKCESTYLFRNENFNPLPGTIDTECPDLYPIQADDGELKWVLSRGGRLYKVGDFKQVDGKWKFIPDEAYENESDGIMNFGKDSYAAMTYYVQDFGTAENPTLPDMIEVNWMNSWAYCNDVAVKNGEKFNGIYNLNLKLGLRKEDGKYVLTQTPVETYKTLRDEDNKYEWKNQTISADSDLLKDFQGDCYEIVSTFKPGNDTRKVGFKVRIGADQETAVIYDVEKEELSIDRSKSGIILNNAFSELDIQRNVKKNADGTIDLYIYVDKSSVEVFTNGYAVAGADQIFPKGICLGAQAFVEGGDATADITIYPLESIWTDKIAPENPTDIRSYSSAINRIVVGEVIDLDAYLMPMEVKQDIIWTVDEGENTVVTVERDETDKKVLHVTGKSAGTAKITAYAEKNPELKKEFNFVVLKNGEFNSNVDTKYDGPHANEWKKDENGLTISNGDNDFIMTVDKAKYQDYVMRAEMKAAGGVINLVLASEYDNPWEGYWIQFHVDGTIKLMKQGPDTTLAEQNMGKIIHDGKFHLVTVEKTMNSKTTVAGVLVRVLVDGEECLTYECEEDFFDGNYHAGLGVWGGGLQVREFSIYAGNAELPTISKDPEDVACKINDHVTLNVKAASEDGGTLSCQWYFSETEDGEGIAIEGAEQAEYKFIAKEEGIFYYYCKITNTNKNAMENQSASVDSERAKVTVTKKTTEDPGNNDNNGSNDNNGNNDNNGSNDNNGQRPDTGDNAMTMVWILCLISALGVIVFLKKKENA